MAETAFQYAPEVLAVAKASKVSPHDVEPCEWCGVTAAVLHLDCTARPFHLIRGSFSPAKTVECAPAKGAWTWRVVGGGSQGLGWRVGLVTRYLRYLRSRRARMGALTARYHRQEISEAEWSLQQRAISHEPAPHTPDWVMRNPWVRVVDRDLGDGVIANISNERGGSSPRFDVHAWGPLVWGQDAERASPDLIEFSCELHPLVNNVARVPNHPAWRPYR